jgi:hypothetical protein
MAKPAESNEELPAPVEKALAARPGCSLLVAHALSRTFATGSAGREEQKRSYYVACPATATARPSRELVYVETRERTLAPPMGGVFDGVLGDVDDGGILGAVAAAVRAVRGAPQPPERKPPGEGGVRV